MRRSNPNRERKRCYSRIDSFSHWPVTSFVDPVRHSHASELLSKGTPIPTVAKRPGHANANITLSMYSHALEEDELAAPKIWNGAMVDVIAASRKRHPQPKPISNTKSA